MVPGTETPLVRRPPGTETPPGDDGKTISLRTPSLRAKACKVVRQIETSCSPDPIMRRPCADREEKRGPAGATDPERMTDQQQLDRNHPNQRRLLERLRAPVLFPPGRAAPVDRPCAAPDPGTPDGPSAPWPRWRPEAWRPHIRCRVSNPKRRCCEPHPILAWSRRYVAVDRPRPTCWCRSRRCGSRCRACRSCRRRTWRTGRRHYGRSSPNMGLRRSGDWTINLTCHLRCGGSR